MKRRSILPLSLAAFSLLGLTGCPGSPGTYPAPYVPSSGSPGPSPTPTPDRSVSGTVYDEETGRPVPAAVVFVGGRLAGFTGIGGTFAASYSATIASPSITVAKSGYANLTVHGFGGGPLAMPRPADAESVTSATRSITVTAPGGSATTALVSIAVMRPGHAFAQTEAFKAIPLSEAGTGSADVALPEGEATVLAYGFDGNLAGSSLGPVGDVLSVELKPTPAFGAFRPEVSAFKSDSVHSVGYYLTWPSESPIAENRVELAVLSGEFVSLGWGLPPVESFGIPGASYTMMADATTLSGDRLLARRERRSVGSGIHPVTWLPEARWMTYRTGAEKYDVTFRINPNTSVPGANAYVLDLLDLMDRKRAWRVVSHQTSTMSVEVPITVPYGLKPGKEYIVQLHSALNPGRFDSSETAMTIGTRYTAIYNESSEGASAYRSLARQSADGYSFPIGVAPVTGEALESVGPAPRQPLRSHGARTIGALLRSTR